MSKFGRSMNEKPWKAKRRNLRNEAPKDDFSAPEKTQDPPDSNVLGNPMTGMASRRSGRFLAEFQTLVVGCRQDVSKLILEKIRDIEQQAISQEATYLSAATDSLAGQDLSKTTKDVSNPDQQVLQTPLSSASKLIEEYETFCEETTTSTCSKEIFANWDDEYRQFASLFSRQRNVMRNRIGPYLDKKFVSSKESPSTGGHSAPEESVWGNLVELMQIHDEDAIEDNWAVAMSRTKRGVQNLVKVIQD